MTAKPEYQKCVTDTAVTKRNRSWCGEEHILSFMFADVDHAALNGRNGGRLTVCPFCLKKILEALSQ